MIRFDWQPLQDGQVGWSCRIDDVTMFAVPQNTRNGKPVRGGRWRAGVTHWDEATWSATRFGRDVHSDLQPTARDARKLAEAVYLEEIASRTVKTC